MRIQTDSRIQNLSVDNHKGLYFQPGAVLELFPQQETPPTAVAGRYSRKKCSIQNAANGRVRRELFELAHIVLACQRLPGWGGALVRTSRPPALPTRSE
jgi:hypothetical protein